MLAPSEREVEAIVDSSISVAPIQSVQDRSVAVMVPDPEVARLPPVPTTNALALVAAVTLAKETELAVIPVIPVAAPVEAIDHVPFPRVSPAAMVTVPEAEFKVSAEAPPEESSTAPAPVMLPRLVKFLLVSITVEPPTWSDPSDKLRLATWEAVEFKRARVLVAAPVMSSVVSPPDNVTFVSDTERSENVQAPVILSVALI